MGEPQAHPHEHPLEEDPGSSRRRPRGSVLRYVDASAFLRALLRQDVESLTLDAVLASSRLLTVECARALERLRLGGELNDGLAVILARDAAGMFARMHLMPVDDRVFDLARQAFGINVRAIDALHVATAQVLAAESGEPVEFWTHDERQARAAFARGLEVKGLT